jgi:SAM-dependent methyltransferase
VQQFRQGGEMDTAMLVKRLGDPAFWGKIWNEARKGSLQARRWCGEGPLEYWNRLAGRFERPSGQEHTGRRVDRVLTWLEQRGVLRPGMKVLDIGAGTGAFTIPLARRTMMVTALEPAPAMLSALRRRVKAEGLANVDFLDWEWEKIDPAAAGLLGRFDLVFASLTPGVADMDALMKMMACSRGWCFLCEFAGRRLSPARDELWRRIFNSEMLLPGHDIIYPLNLLYALGCYPSLQVWADMWVEEMPLQEAMVDLENFFGAYTEITPELKRVIADYVEWNGVNGKFSENYKARLGMVVWLATTSWSAGLSLL